MPRDDTNNSVTLHGLFDLKPEVTRNEFAAAYGAFAAHLGDEGYLIAWNYSMREPHDYFNSTAPSQLGTVALKFESLERAAACLEYVRADREPLRALHLGIRTRVVNISFFLTRPVLEVVDYTTKQATRTP